MQAMQQAQPTGSIIGTSTEARNIRGRGRQRDLTQLQLAAAGAPGGAAGRYRVAIAKYEAAVADQNKKKEELRVQADTDQRRPTTR